MADWRNRIVGYDVVEADQLLANPSNWRVHPKAQQDALTGVLDDVGWVQEIIVNKTTGHVVDGHMRVEVAITRGESVPVKYVELSEDEEKLILATIDPISAMAATDAAQLEALLADVNSDSAAVQAMLEQLAAKSGLIEPDNPYDEWQGMPEFENENVTAYHSIKVHFDNENDLAEFSRLVNQTVTKNTTYIYYPKQEKENLKAYRAINE
jgi:hypothetical protein